MWSNIVQESSDDKYQVLSNILTMGKLTWMLLEAKPLSKRHGQNDSGDGEVHSVLVTGGHACIAMDSLTGTLQLWPLLLILVSHFSYVGVASVHSLVSLRKLNWNHYVSTVTMVFVPLFSHSSITCYKIWVNAANSEMCFAQAKEGGWQWSCTEEHQTSLAVVHVMLKRPPGHALSSAQAESRASIRARGFPSWKRMWWDEKG